MKSLRQSWMVRAALASIIVGLVLIAWTVLAIWIYRKVAGVAPEWMLVDRRRGWSLLETAGAFAYSAVTGTGGLALTVGLFRLLRVPDEALLPDAPLGDYPFHNRTLSPEARIRAGQEGYLDEKLRQFDELRRNPLAPPARKRD